MRQLFHLFFYDYISLILIHFSETDFSLACFICWQRHLKKYSKSICFGILAIVSFIFFLVLLILLVRLVLLVPFFLFFCISSFSLNYSCFSINVLRFFFLIGLTFLYASKKINAFFHSNLRILWLKIFLILSNIYCL